MSKRTQFCLIGIGLALMLAGGCGTSHDNGSLSSPFARSDWDTVDCDTMWAQFCVEECPGPEFDTTRFQYTLPGHLKPFLSSHPPHLSSLIYLGVGAPTHWNYLYSDEPLPVTLRASLDLRSCEKYSEKGYAFDLLVIGPDPETERLSSSWPITNSGACFRGPPDGIELARFENVSCPPVEQSLFLDAGLTFFAIVPNTRDSLWLNIRLADERAVTDIF